MKRSALPRRYRARAMAASSCVRSLMTRRRSHSDWMPDEERTTHNQQRHQPMSTTTDNRIVEPYLFFDGRCEEALDFYRQALDAEVLALIRYKDSPEPNMCMPGVDKDKVMHALFRIGETKAMASDGR